MGPGPGNPYPEVTAAFTRPLLGHLDPEFLVVLDEIGDRLRQVWQTANQLTFALSGTGSAGMEASFVNVVTPGDVVVVGVNGVFGERMCDVAGRCGAEVVRVEAPWGQPLDPEAVLSAHPHPAVIAVVHAETSTGVRNDVAAIAAHKGDALVIADCVTSLAGIEVAIDDWGIDIAYAGTQKCLGVPPGLAPFTMGERARAQLVERPQSWYLDVSMLANYVTAGSTRAYHHTAPITMLFGLHAGLGVVLDEGLGAGWARHANCGTALVAGLVDLGFEPLAPASHRLPQLTSVRVPHHLLPAGMDEAACRRALLDRWGIEVGGGLGPLAGDVWRIGLMGHTARPRNVMVLLAALAELLGQ